MPLRNLLVITLAIVVSLACYSVASKNRYANLFGEAIGLVRQKALKEVPTDELFQGAMDGMLKKLDRHSRYISGKEYQIFNEDIHQEFGGVGMYLESNPQTHHLFVLAPIPDTPASEAGLQVGDEIIEIDGKNVVGIKRTDAVKLLRGPIKKPVKLLIERAGKRFPVELVRASIPLPSVRGDYRDENHHWQFTLKSAPRIGYIRLSQFGTQSADEFEAALTAIQNNIDGLIIDLRNNGGGLLDVAVRLCDDFLEKGKTIVSTRGRHQKLIEETKAKSDPILDPSIPIVILINRNSASASEIMAGCLQDHHRATIIGEQSWGKGTVQIVITMQQKRSALKLTTASYWRPSGKHIDRDDPISQKTQTWGVHPEPGFAIKMTEDEVIQNLRDRDIRDLESLIPADQREILEDIRKTLLAPPSGATTEGGETKTPATPEPDTPQPDAPHVDRPLQRAIEYLQSLRSQKKSAA